jgi:hypothetical protein
MTHVRASFGVERGHSYPPDFGGGTTPIIVKTACLGHQVRIAADGSGSGEAEREADRLQAHPAGATVLSVVRCWRGLKLGVRFCSALYPNIAVQSLHKAI